MHDNQPMYAIAASSQYPAMLKPEQQHHGLDEYGETRLPPADSHPMHPPSSDRILTLQKSDHDTDWDTEGYAVSPMSHNLSVYDVVPHGAPTTTVGVQQPLVYVDATEGSVGVVATRSDTYVSMDDYHPGNNNDAEGFDKDEEFA